MSSAPQYYEIKIQRNAFSYGFELKDEGRPFKKFAIVSKITNNVALESGLKVGDKVVAINGESVNGRDYIYLRNIIRKSLDNCVILEIFKEMDSQIISPDMVTPQDKFTPFKLCFGRNLIPTGSTREKISLFQEQRKKDSKKSLNGFSNSLEFINRCDHDFHPRNNENRRHLNRVTSISVDNLMQDAKSSESDLEPDINKTISQEPFLDDSIFISQDTVKIHLPSTDVRVIDTKPIAHIETPHSVVSNDTVFELISEPFDDKPIQRPLIPRLEMPELSNSFSIPSGFCQLSPELMNTKSRSSNNIFQDVTVAWSNKRLDNEVSSECASMSNVNTSDKKIFFNDKKIARQNSLLTNIPIKLRILQFHDKVKSRGWTDYIIEPEPNGARFRKRYLENLKSDRTSNFIIRTEDINKFDLDSPHRRHKTPSNTDEVNQESLSKYSLMAFNSRVQIKFHFNPSIFQDHESSSRAYTTYKEIINSFKAASTRFALHSNIKSLSQFSNNNLSLSDYQKCFKTVQELNTSVDELTNLDHNNSTSNSIKSTSKSSTENISSTTFDISQTSSKSIFKQAMDKIKPERKVKVTQSYQVFTGTKAEFEEFQKQLEGGHLPLELDSSDENGLNFNRYIYEVPRMNKTPKIPMVIYLCAEIVEKIGLKTEGIYRISGNQRVIRTLSNTLNKPLNEIESNLPEWNNVHAVCGTLKLFLRKLKQYLIPADLSHVLAYSCKGVDCDNPQSLSKTLMDIRYHLSSYQITSRGRSNNVILDQVECRWESLQYLLKHLAKVVACRKFNNMDEHAVSICFNPVIMESWQNNVDDIKADNEIMVKALELILVHQDWLFNNWHSDIDSSQLVENAQKYATEFIDKKYEFNIKLCDQEDEIDSPDLVVDVNFIVEQIVSQSTTKFGEKKLLERRHSSHTPGQKPIVLRDEVEKRDDAGLRRNSQTTDALDLFMCANWMKPFAKVSTIEENKEIKVTYIPSTDPRCDIFAPCVSDGHILNRPDPLNKTLGRNIIGEGDPCCDVFMQQSSQKCIRF